MLTQQVVLTNGTVVNATINENADLYKSLKGGLSNFGREIAPNRVNRGLKADRTLFKVSSRNSKS